MFNDAVLKLSTLSRAARQRLLRSDLLVIGRYLIPTAALCLFVAGASALRAALIRSAQTNSPAAMREAWSAALPTPVAPSRTLLFSHNDAVWLAAYNRTVRDRNTPPSFVVRTGTVEEWTIENTERYRYEFSFLAPVRFVVAEVDGVQQRRNRWRSTVALPKATKVPGDLRPGVVKLWIDFRDPALPKLVFFHFHTVGSRADGTLQKFRIAPAIVGGTVDETPLSGRTSLADGLQQALTWLNTALASRDVNPWPVSAHVCGPAPVFKAFPQ